MDGAWNAAHDRLGRLPPALQPGSGSWDVLAGVVATYQSLYFQLDSQLSYKANGEANGFRFGNVSEFDVSLQYRLWARRLGSGVPAFVYGVLEANLIHAERNRIEGIADPNAIPVGSLNCPGSLPRRHELVRYFNDRVQIFALDGGHAPFVRTALPPAD